MPHKSKIGGVIGGAARFLGIEEFGTRLGSELVRFTPEGRDLERLRKEGLKVNAVYLDPKKTKKTHYHKIVTKFQPMSADIPKRLREINNRLK